TATLGACSPEPNVCSVRWFASYAEKPGIENCSSQRLETCWAENAPKIVSTIQPPATMRRCRMITRARRASRPCAVSPSILSSFVLIDSPLGCELRREHQTPETHRAAPADRRRHRSSPWVRRQGDVGVLDQKSDDRPDIPPVEGTDESLRDLIDARVSERAQRRPLAVLGHPLLDGLAGALQGAVYGYDRRAQRLRDLLGREPQHVSENEHHPLSRRQVPECHDERKLHRLALLVAALGCGVPILEAQQLFRGRLHPRRIRGPSPLRGAVSLPVVDGQDPLGPTRD